MEVSNSDWDSLNFLCQHSFTEEACIAMSLDLKLELVVIDVLEVKLVFPGENHLLLIAQVPQVSFHFHENILSLLFHVAANISHF